MDRRTGPNDFKYLFLPETNIALSLPNQFEHDNTIFLGSSSLHLLACMLRRFRLSFLPKPKAAVPRLVLNDSSLPVVPV